MKRTFKVLLSLLLTLGSLISEARADEVTEWNQHMLDALIAANAGGIVATRHAAIVQAAVYDAVNGIQRRYTPIYVTAEAVPGASVRAAVVQAAYEVLVKLFPNQKADLDAKRAASLTAISSVGAAERSRSIIRGLAWGTRVANEIWARRSADGFNTVPAPYFGETGVGLWRATPPARAPFAAVQLGGTTPWVLQSAKQFTLPGPPALNSAKYAADFNEVKQIGSISSVTRTTAETAIARFWASGHSPSYFWNRVAVRLGEQRHTTIWENARLLALVNIAMADAGIAIWEAKVSYMFWRPITAIAMADLDGNSATTSDPNWLPLLATPPYAEYPSGLVGTSAAPAAVLANFFGPATPFVVDSNAMPGVTRYFPDFAAAIDELVNARIFSGIHFRFADEDARHLGASIGNYVSEIACRPLKVN